MKKSDFLDCGLKLIGLYLGATSVVQFIQLTITLATIGSLGGMPSRSFTLPASASLLKPILEILLSIIFFALSNRIAVSIYPPSSSDQ